MSTSNDDPDPWHLWELPSIGEMRNVSHEDDFAPTPDGQVRCYFDGTLMRSLHSCRFSAGFDAELGQTEGLVFQAPVAMWPDDSVPEAALQTLMTEDEIPIEEREHDDSQKRRFVPADAVTWDFEIVLETTPYEPDQ